jgi:hypothetical protein
MVPSSSSSFPSSSSPPSSPTMRSGRPMNDLIRLTLLACVAVLSGFTFFHLHSLQRTFGTTFDVVDIAFPTFSHFTPPTQRAHYPPTAMDGPIININTTITSTIEFLLPCLVHEPVAINASEKRVSDPTKTGLEHLTINTS